MGMTINPLWFYLANVVDTLNFILLFLGLFLIITGALIVIDSNNGNITDGLIGSKFVIVGMAAFLLFIFIPSRLTVLQMAVAYNLDKLEVNENVFYYIVNTAKALAKGM